MTRRSTRSERHALPELNEAIAALSPNQRGETTTEHWTRPSWRAASVRMSCRLVMVDDED